jgi:uncharacterized membrane protein YeiH
VHPTLFSVPLWADLLAVGIGALQGATFAAQFRDRRLDLLGVAIIGIATGLGGGLLRDVLLSELPAALSNNWYLIVATGAALLGMLLERLFSRMSVFITVLDALTIGLYCAIGTTKALAFGLPPVPAVFVGVLSAVGGSIIRDLLLGVPVAVMSVGSSSIRWASLCCLRRSSVSRSLSAYESSRSCSTGACRSSAGSNGSPQSVGPRNPQADTRSA